MIQKEYKELLHILHQKLIPLEAYYEVSTRCNFQCVHCYNKNNNYSELKYDEIDKVISFIKESNVLTVILTGGEFFLHPYALRILDKLYKAKKFELIVYTNASLIDDTTALFLKERNIRLEISIYGVSPEIYETVTGSAKNYFNVIKGLEILDKYKVNYRLKGIVIKQNYKEANEIKKMITKHNGIETEVEWGIFGHSEEIKECRLNEEQCIELYRLRKIEKTDGVSFGECNAGKMQYCIRPDGSIVPCVGWNNMVIGNVFDDFYKSIVDRFDINKIIDKKIKCHCCEDAAFCNTCPMIFYQDTGNHMMCSDELCRQAFLAHKIYNEQNTNM